MAYQGKHAEQRSNTVIVEDYVPPRTVDTLADIIQEGYMTRGVNMTGVSEVIYVPPTDPETVQNLFRSWLTMSGHTAYTMGVAKANGAATMSERDAYSYLHRNLFPMREITAITITYANGRYGVHVYAKDEG
jgi:hypothetical protein